MVQPLAYLRETASQTAGPYVHIGLAPNAAGFQAFEQELGRDLAGPDAAGERISVEGIVFDGMSAPVKDVLIEVWQANAAGIYASPEDPRAAEVEPGFRGWGRVISDFESGKWSFETIKPGPVPGRGGPGRGGSVMAPHLNLWIVARGINLGLNTRLYFDDETAANAEDPVLGAVMPPHRRSTLIAERGVRGPHPVYHFDIWLQGDEETVFFDI